MITYKQVNNLQYLHADSLDTAVAVWEHLVDKCDGTMVSYMTNVDDPRDVTFIVGAVNEETLHEFIIKNADFLSQLSYKAACAIRNNYTHEDRESVLLPCPGARSVEYSRIEDIRDGVERGSSWWYDLAYDRTYAKDYILENRVRFSSHKFVKVRD